MLNFCCWLVVVVVVVAHPTTESPWVLILAPVFLKNAMLKPHTCCWLYSVPSTIEVLWWSRFPCWNGSPKSGCQCQHVDFSFVVCVRILEVTRRTTQLKNITFTSFSKQKARSIVQSFMVVSSQLAVLWIRFSLLDYNDTSATSSTRKSLDILLQQDSQSDTCIFLPSLEVLLYHSDTQLDTVLAGLPRPRPPAGL